MNDKMILNQDELENNIDITRPELLRLLKSEAVKIHITHIMNACNYLIE